ncbi:MAG: peptidylprolyl isomerase [Candidatus Eisenbacteria sp.]|nr:peptidylprolyl isomerase [Candidatus Eisenbacteria bacterium]
MRRMHGMALLCVVAVLAGFGGRALADSAERIVAIVDEDPILLSELEAQLLIAMQGFGIDPGDSVRVGQLREQILEQAIDQRVLFQEAKQQEIRVSEQEVARTVEDAIARSREEIGSEQLFKIQLQREGMTEEDLRQRYMEQARSELMVSRLVQSRMGGEISVDPEEVRRYYEEHRSEFPQREAQVHLQHILIRVRPDSLLLGKARDLALEVAEQIRSGAISFVDAAQRYSDDPNGRDGGDLQHIHRGDFSDRLGRDFEEALFSLEPGQVSEPLASPLGYHLVLAHEKDLAGGWVHASHILFAVPMVKADEARARSRAQELFTRLDAGESFGDLARRYSDDPHSRDRGGDLGFIPRQSLDPVILQAINSLAVGGVAQPVAAEGAFHIFRVLGLEAKRDYAFDEIEEELLGWVRKQKMEQRYQELVEEVKQRHYIERRSWGEN